jgi:hypothetical protein
MKYFAVGEDKTLVDITELVLALAGGSMTGSIAFNSGVRNRNIIRFISGNKDGSGISIGDGGSTVIGGGESAALLEPASGSGDAERLILANDGAIDFYVNCQNGLDSAKHVTLNTAGLLSGHQKAITSGTAAPSGGSNGDIYIQY